MYTEELLLNKQLAIVDKAFSLSTGEEIKSYTLVPSNHAEIYIPIGKSAIYKSVGSARPFTFLKHTAYFLMPRRRGAEICLEDNAQCLIIKLNAIYAKSISNDFVRISNNVFEANYPTDCIDKFITASIQNDQYALSDLLQKCCSNKDELFEYNYTILDSIEQIRLHSGNLSIKEIYTSMEISKSKLEQHFNREIGLTPKEFCKIEKLNNFLRTFRENPKQSLTELTYQCGYYDQSHLIKDFRYFLDESPKRFLLKD